MASNRIVIVEGIEESESLAFNSETLLDSEALHQLLSRIDPGEEYTVYFRRIKDSDNPVSETEHQKEHDWAVSEEYSRWIGDPERV